MTVTATPEPEPDPAVEPEPEPEPEPSVEEAPEPPAEETTPAGRPEADGTDTFVMPREVGNDLQTAQDNIQSVTDNFLFISFSEDATGEGRSQIIDSGWVVCSQEPKAGQVFGYDTEVTFFVVRESESCP